MDQHLSRGARAADYWWLLRPGDELDLDRCAKWQASDSNGRAGRARRVTRRPATRNTDTEEGRPMTRDSPQIDRYAASSDDPGSGNPAGVVLDAGRLGATEMQHIATQLGYSETAFVTGPISRTRPVGRDQESGPGDAPIPIRYFAPEGEVDFCGHATIATAVAIGETLGAGDYLLSTRVGPVAITARREGTRTIGTLRSPAIHCFPLEPRLRTQLLDTLHWVERDLDPDFTPAIGFGGNRHLVLVARDLTRLETLAYDFNTLQRLSRQHNWVTVHLVAATGPGQWRARDPFPWGGVVEDPATGAAAAAFAGYLRSQGRATVGDTFVITQGVEMGRPSRIEVELLEDAALVSGTTVRIPELGHD